MSDGRVISEDELWRMIRMLGFSERHPPSTNLVEHIHKMMTFGYNYTAIFNAITGRDHDS